METDPVQYNNSPTISDLILFDLVTTDLDGNPIDAYKITQIVIYFVSRVRSATNVKTLSVDVEGSPNDNYYNNALPVAIFGDATTPAWLATDPDNAFVEKIELLTGVYRLRWRPELCREGDYVICYRWVPIPAGDELSRAITFFVLGDTSATTVIPTHFTMAGKYEMLLDRYTPNMYKMTLSNDDLTSSVISRLNKSVAKGFTTLEDMANQVIDLYDANSLKDIFLPYLANMFHIKLRSNDTQLWRRQLKRAVPVFKKKGTLPGLTEALANAGILLQRFTQLWQVRSKSVRTDSFLVSAVQAVMDEPTFILSELAVLPINEDNFEVAIRLAGTLTYTVLSSDYVTMATVDGDTVVTWIGAALSVNPIALEEGDVVRILYQVAPVDDQEVEDYLRTLPLMDLRDETEITYPKKNWNVKVIEDDDDMFPVICPALHPYTDKVVWGKVRTEFPYSENAYNMETYNGSTRDSTNPCDIDKDYQESCSCCISSKFNLEVEIADISSDRIEETQDIVNEYTPFHAVAHKIIYGSGVDEFMLAPIEEQECLVRIKYVDSLVDGQFDFNRLIEDGSSDAGELTRSDLASLSTQYSGTGTGKNDKVVFYSPGISFRNMHISNTQNNLLEILSGTSAGDYEVTVEGDQFLAIVQNTPDATANPVSLAEVAYQLSNVMYEQSDASIYGDDLHTFFDEDLILTETAIEVGWQVTVTSGVYAGTYPVSVINSDNTFVITGINATTSVSALHYQLKTAGNVVVKTSATGNVITARRGRLEMDLVATELSFVPGDYVLLSGTQYIVDSIVARSGSPLVDKIYLRGYTGGDVVGTTVIRFLRRLSSGTGFLDYTGMTLTGTTPIIDGTLENDKFKDNYTILIGSDYYQIAEINGSDMKLIGPPLAWGLSGTSVSYSVVQFIKTSPVTTQSGQEFDRLDRRGNESFDITTETAMFMAMTSGTNPRDLVGLGDDIDIQINYRGNE